MCKTLTIRRNSETPPKRPPNSTSPAAARTTGTIPIAGVYMRPTQGNWEEGFWATETHPPSNSVADCSDSQTEMGATGGAIPEAIAEHSRIKAFSTNRMRLKSYSALSTSSRLCRKNAFVNASLFSSAP